MRLLFTLIAMASLAALLACGQTQPESGSVAVVHQSQVVSAALPQAAASHETASNLGMTAIPAADQEAPDAGGGGGDFPTVPDGALYTIFCLTIDTPTHVPDADRLKQQLIAKTNSHDWYVIHSQNVSTLYYGFFKTFDDDAQPQEKARAQAALHSVQGLKDNNGDFPFANCIFQPINSPDPPAPAEWNLKNAKGFWTVQIAAYVGSPLRKKYAVDAVKAARAMGVEAYFYHGRSVSSVCVGVWPREAVKEQDAADAEADSPAKHIMVLPQPLPAGARTDNIYDPDGSKVKVVVPRVEIADPTLKAMLVQYPNNVVNGEIRYHTEHTATGDQKVAEPSFLVIIPQGDNPDAAPAETDTGAPTLPGLLNNGSNDAGDGQNPGAGNGQ